MLNNVRAREEAAGQARQQVRLAVWMPNVTIDGSVGWAGEKGREGRELFLAALPVPLLGLRRFLILPGCGFYLGGSTASKASEGVCPFHSHLVSFSRSNCGRDSLEGKEVQVTARPSFPFTVVYKTNWRK